MSRWFIEEYSEEESDSDELQIEIEEDTTPHEVPEEIPLDYFLPKQKGPSQASSKQSNIIECQNLLDSIIQNIDNNQIQKSHTEFNKLQDVYKQAQKDLKKNYVPNFIIKKLFEINQRINEQSKSNKQARQFQKDLKKFNRNFEKELSEYEQHPENFQKEDEFEFKEEPLKKSDDDFYLSSSDDEEEAQKSANKPHKARKRKEKANQNANSKSEVKRSDPTATATANGQNEAKEGENNSNNTNKGKEGENNSNNTNDGKEGENANNKSEAKEGESANSVKEGESMNSKNEGESANNKSEAKEGESANSVKEGENNSDNTSKGKDGESASNKKADDDADNIASDDESIREVLRKYVCFKTNIAMKTDIDYLFSFYQKVTDKNLARQFQLEICYAASHIPNWQKVSYRNIPKILTFLPDLVGYAKGLVPLFGRFNKDLTWYSTKLTTPSRRYHFYRMIHKFVNQINNFKQKLLEMNEFKQYLRLEAMFIGLMYSNEKYDLSSHSLSMFKILEKDVFSTTITENYMYQASLFSAFNLAIRKNISGSVETLSKIQNYNSKFFSDSQNVFMLTRALVQVGFSAFDELLFRSAYECFSKLIKLKLLNESNLTEKVTYPQLPSIEYNSVIVRYILSSIIFNLPYIVTGINENKVDEDKVTSFFESLSPDEKQVLVTKYFIFVNMINYTKACEWKNAYSLLISNFGNILNNRDEFLVVVKKLLLCSYLLTFKSSTVKVNFLENKFKMEKKSIFEIVNNMIDGVGPIGNNPIQFNGQISEDKKIIQINMIADK